MPVVMDCALQLEWLSLALDAYQLCSISFVDRYFPPDAGLLCAFILLCCVGCALSDWYGFD